MTEKENKAGSRTYKDTLFRTIFMVKENLLSLYNAMCGTNYDNPDDLEIVTLEKVVYLSVKNDLAFIMDFQMYLYEHQSTYNRNMPLRDLLYVAKEYEKLVDVDKLHRRKMVKIPTPEFVVFYNGEENRPEVETMCLSDAFIKQVEEPKLELRVKVLNINAGKNKELMTACKVLKDYSEFVDRVRRYRKVADELMEAIERAVEECIKEGILAEFLIEHRAEVLDMCWYEVDEEKVMQYWKEDLYEEGYEDGVSRGRTEGITDGITIGRTELLTTLIQKKLAKGKSLEEIAEELEEDIEVIQELCKNLQV